MGQDGSYSEGREYACGQRGNVQVRVGGSQGGENVIDGFTVPASSGTCVLTQPVR